MGKSIIIEVAFCMQSLAGDRWVLADVLSGAPESGKRYRLVPVGGDSPKVAHGASDTSLRAAERAAPKVGTQRHEVLGLFRNDNWNRSRGSGMIHGFTDSEMAHASGLPLNSVRPRRLELVEGGWVRDSGRRRDGSTVWEYVR